MFETCIDLSNTSSLSFSAFSLTQSFQIIDATTPDHFILSSSAVFELFFQYHQHHHEQQSLPPQLLIDDPEENERLQRKIELCCRNRKLILRFLWTKNNNKDQRQDLLAEVFRRCAFLDVPHLLISQIPDEEEVDESVFDTILQLHEQYTPQMKTSFEIKTVTNMKIFSSYSSRNNNNASFIGLWYSWDTLSNIQQQQQSDLSSDAKNHHHVLLPFFMSQNCFGITINRSASDKLDLELISEFAARGSILNIDLASSSVLDQNQLGVLSADRVQESVAFLAMVIKTVIEDVGCSIQRKATLFHRRKLQKECKKEETRRDNNDNEEETSIARDLSLSSTSNDRLQHPLQPLSESLSRTIYAEFEKDCPKYEKYQEAIDLALIDLLRHFDIPAGQKRKNLVIVVLGAGSRGPLVSCVIKSLAKINNRNDDSSLIKVFAIEQNKLAFYMLQRKVSLAGDSSASLHYLIHGDGRDQQVTDQIINQLVQTKDKDQNSLWNLLLISELLGSFGDNELSPECIEGFIVSLHNSCINFNNLQLQQQQEESASISSNKNIIVIDQVKSIPEKYTSYVSLASLSPKLTAQYRDAREEPYVVKATNVWTKSWRVKMDAQKTQENGKHKSHPHHIAPLFTFDHSFPSSMNLSQIVEHKIIIAKNNHLKKEIEFVCSDETSTTAVNGIIGYFDCQLYSVQETESENHHQVSLSIVPVVEEHTPDLYSWFPIVFPLRLKKQKAKVLKLVMERKRSERQVCYEWGVGESDESAVQMNNVDGKWFAIKL